jgi:hypothetical protein
VEVGPVTAVQRFAHRRPLLTYFAIVYSVSAGSLAVLGLPRLDAGATQNPISLVVFPVLIISVAAAGVTLTAVNVGRAGLDDLGSRMRRLRIRPAFYWSFSSLRFGQGRDQVI